MDDKLSEVLERYPFLTYGTLQETAYVGIVQNSDAQLISLYALDAIPTLEARRLFLDLGSEWWWESNRQIPINIFLKDRFRAFRPYLKHFSRKDFNLLAGPTVSLQETISRRIRKKQVQVTLVRYPDPETT